MAKLFDDFIDENLREEAKTFAKKTKSEMHFNLDLSGGLNDLEWLDIIEEVCPYIDNVVRHPKLTLIREELTVKTEKSKKVNVASVKDLARHTNYITKVDKKTDEVQPEKILDIRNEETYNIYENRFLFTLIDNLNRFMLKKEDLLKNLEMKNHKMLEYVGNSKTSREKVHIEVKVTSEELPKNENDPSLDDDVNSILFRVRRIREYLTSWEKSEMIKTLAKLHVPPVLAPLKRTNIIIKNPNFQMAVKLWNFFQTYGIDEEEPSKNIIDTNGDEKLIAFLDRAFLFDYLMLDSVEKKKREEKEKLCKVVILMLSEEIERTLRYLNDNGFDLTKEELLSNIVKEIKYEKGTRLVGTDDVKKKFKSVMDEYLERTQENLE